MEKWKDELWYIHAVKYSAIKKEWSPGTHYNMEDPLKHHATWKKPDTKGTGYMMPFYGTVRIGKSTEMEGHLAAARSWWGEHGSNGEWPLNRNKAFHSLEWWRRFGTQQRRRLYHSMNVWTATELYTWKWLALGYVGFTSAKKKRKWGSLGSSAV